MIKLILLPDMIYKNDYCMKQANKLNCDQQDYIINNIGSYLIGLFEIVENCCSDHIFPTSMKNDIKKIYYTMPRDIISNISINFTSTRENINIGIITDIGINIYKWEEQTKLSSSIFELKTYEKIILGNFNKYIGKMLKFMQLE